MMSVINSFLKKRIEKLVRECDSPMEIFEQLEEVIDFKSDEEAKELMDYLISAWMETPRENLLGNSPRDFMEKAMAREMGMELDEDEEELMEQLIDSAEEDLMIAFERASEILDKRMKYSKRGIFNKKFDLSRFHNEISNLPLVINLRKFLEYIERKKSGYIRITDYGEVKPGVAGKVRKVLGDCPKLISLNILGTEKKNPYINFLIHISVKTGLTQKKEIKGTSDRKIVLADKGRSFIRGENVDEIFPKLFIKWLYDRGISKSSIYSMRMFGSRHSHDKSRIIYSLLQTGKDWVGIRDAFIPMIALFNDNIMEILEQGERNKESLEELQEIAQEYNEMEMKYYELFGLLETRLKEGSGEEVRLTDLGYYFLEELFKKIHILCRINVKLMFAKVKSDYLDFVILADKNIRTGLEEDGLYEQLCNLSIEHEATLMDFLHDIEFLEEDKKEAKLFEKSVDGYLQRLDENLCELKKRYSYE